MDISDILASLSAPPVDQRALDLQALTRAWINERSSPELLPYPESIIQRCSEGVSKQIETIESMTTAMDPSANFTLVILQTELERFKFLIRSLLRARIAKIDQYPIYYRGLSAANTESQPLLSALESEYLETHQSLLQSHYTSSFLSLFPKTLQGGSPSMVDKPDDDTAVFCRVLRDGYAQRPIDGDVELKRGDVWVLRWSSVKEGTRRGDIELI